LRDDFVSRDRVLDKIRADLYESGTAVRDFILVGNDEDAAQSLLAELRDIHSDMQKSLKTYSHSLRADEMDAFHDLVTENRKLLGHPESHLHLGCANQAQPEQFVSSFMRSSRAAPSS
jgi:hypothetical protein